MGLEDELELDYNLHLGEENLSEKYDKIRKEKIERVYNGKLYHAIFPSMMMYLIATKQ